MTNASNEGICDEFERKNNTTIVNLLSNCWQVLNLSRLTALNIIFDDFSIWLLGYRAEFSCLYLPQGHYGYCMASTDECIFFILSKSLSLTFTLEFISDLRANILRTFVSRFNWCLIWRDSTRTIKNSTAKLMKFINLTLWPSDHQAFLTVLKIHSNC